MRLPGDREPGQKASTERRIGATDVSAVVDEATKLLHDLVSVHPDLSEPIGLGVQISGQVDDQDGSVRRSHRMGWDQPVALANLLGRATGYHAVVNHDVRTIVLAEQAFGLGRQRRSFAVVTVGAGVGAGLVIERRLWRGESCAAAELGHMVLEPGGRRCPCGNHGCLETIAGADGVLQSLNADGRQVGSIEAAAELARADDPAARRAFQRAGEALGRGLSWLVTLTDPGLVAVWVDPTIHAVDGYEATVLASFHEHGFYGSTSNCKLVFLEHSHEEGARSAGAMLLSLRAGVGAPDRP